MSWDDGSHAKVKKVQLTFDDIIYSIQVTYDGTTLQSQLRGSVGPKSAEFTLDSDEYITAFSAYGNSFSTQDVITALTFTTNKRALGPYGKTSSFQSSSPEAIGKQIAGFLGTSDNVLKFIDVHYAAIPTKIGTRTGTETGTGTKKLNAQGLTKEIVINHPDEYIVSVEGWYDSSNIILGIQFKTNQKTSEFIGYEFDGSGTKFTLQFQEKKITGFHGYASNYLNSIGAYFFPSLSTTTLSTLVKKLKAEGGETRAEWDDGHHDDVKKVYVGQGLDGISAVKFEYKNGSQVVFGVERGKNTKLGFEEFELESDEYVTSVEGTYDSVYGVDGGVIVTMLIFNTNKNRTSGQLGLESSTRFELKEEGYKITGFHGRAGEAVNAIGAYLSPLGTISLIPATPSEKLEGFGSDEGTSWDDGAFDGIRKVSLDLDWGTIIAIMFVYDKGPLIGNEHGSNGNHRYYEFEIDYPSEYITSVDGTYYQISGDSGSYIRMLRFNTNKQTYGPFGFEDGTPFVLKKDGHKIVGFHGSSSDLLHKLGVHILPITRFHGRVGEAYLAPLETIPLIPATLSHKLEGCGSDEGTSWDDGAFNGIRKVSVKLDLYLGVEAVMFVYDKGPLIGNGHGSNLFYRSDEFELDYPSEYITAIDGAYHKISGYYGCVIKMLRFKTNKQTYGPFGFEDGTPFILKKDGYKIVGFHGSSSVMLHKLGVHVLPIST